MKYMKKVAVAAVAVGALALAGCTADADVAGQNVSKAADQFEVNRRVVFYNGITDKYMLTIEGKCAIKDENGQLEVTCKVGKDSYKKHFLGLSDNVTYVVEHLEPTTASDLHYRVIFKPEVILPEVTR